MRQPNGVRPLAVPCVGYRSKMKEPILSDKIPLILASGSPRRRDILTEMGLSFTVCVSEADETVADGTPPREASLLIARRKAEAVLPTAPADALILAADTVVELNGAALGKPRDDADALRMLTALAGRSHAVHTAVAVIYRGRVLSDVATTAVRFRAADREELLAYIATGEPRDKAGAYGIQGKGGALVAAIDGDFDNVVGLPSRLVARLIREVTA